MKFNDKFVWGVATASFQIEGARFKDGKKDSIWDTFTHINGKIVNNANGDTACNHYELFKEDIALLKELGVKAYRFSISWPRIIPDGTGEVNQKGIEFYKNLIDELLINGIEPYVTLYHWDLPQALEDKGGFLNSDISNWFSNYVNVVTKAFGNKVKYYTTINEPQCIIYLGYQLGINAPGKTYNNKQILQIIHNMLLCHGKATKIIRNNVANSIISFAPCSTIPVPARDDKELEAAAYERYFGLRKEEYANLYSIYMDPVILGDYPKQYYEMFDKDDYPMITKEDLETIHQPIDYLSQNIYSGYYVDFDENHELTKLPFYDGIPETNISWGRVVPKALYYGPKFLYQRYKLPIVITENGMCNCDVVCLDGKVHDAYRIDFVTRYLSELNKVSKEIPILGYFYWSLLDNFEWAQGYTKRFGLVFVNYQTFERTRKDSFYYYQGLIKNNEV